MGIFLIFGKGTKLFKVELGRLIQVDAMRLMAIVDNSIQIGAHVGCAERLTPIYAYLFTDLVCLALLLVETALENQVVKSRRVYSLVDQFEVECLHFNGLR